MNPHNARRRIQRGAWRSRRGMSLVEIMVVIAIIVTVTSIIGYGIMQVWENSRVETTKLQMGRVVERIQIHTVKHKKAPTMGEGLAAVYRDEPIPTDSWGNEFVYVTPGPNGADYDIISYGRDGVQGGTGNNEDIHLSDLGR